MIGKRRQKNRTEGGSDQPSSQSSAQPITTLKTTSSIAKDAMLGHKMRVLLHDFLNVSKDPSAERRINQTTDEHYISLPYFDAAEADIVKTAIVDIAISQHFMNAGMLGVDDDNVTDSPDALSGHVLGKPFAEAVREMLKGFIDKRRASQDTRPCGPHHLAPLYASIFGVDLEELKDEKFLRRLRRYGL
ncbi:hypothetical protein NLU13_0407 [Sarocladium strictum]|uniref:Uncharacterized protein n=1 Tax=Sarocladium strictum TaxID=5046 RepID=A0AA39LBG9_SARSR|nr:hypothetical protein NLU13_0407 [Sarocladium strictum]